tara:strand:- start:690 stop:2051 length:1362 start_codon:yes stop_codon:yes gene_type:complete
MPTTSTRRQRVIEFSTPKVADLVVVEVVDASRNVSSSDSADNTAYGTAHPDSSKFPSFKLSLIKNADSDQGQYQYWYYVKDRDDQDDYNWEFQAAGASNPIYDTVVKTYVILRSSYNEDSPLLGTNMPSREADPFTTNAVGFDPEYILFEKKQVRSGDETLDSLYVIEQQVYVKRVPIRRTDVDSEFDIPLKSKETIYYKGETVFKTTAFGATDTTETTGVKAAALFKRNKVPNDFFGTYLESNSLESQTNQNVGILREGRQLTDNWYAIAEREVMKTNTTPTEELNLIKKYFTYQNYTWPAVLLRIEDENWSRRDGGHDTIVYPIYKKGTYSGPTKVQVELFWRVDKFTVGSSKEGSTTELATINPMLPEPCVFQTPIASVNVPPTLHDMISVTGSTGTDHPVYSYIGTTWTFLATNYTDWPDSLVISDTQKPFRGGYLRERVTAYKPVAGT